MNICKSIVVAVPETGLKYEIRIDLVKATLLDDNRIGWLHLGTRHIADKSVKVGNARFIVSIQGVKYAQIDHAGSTSLVTDSRCAANALFQAWHSWANNEALVQEIGGAKKVRLLPRHSLYWNL